MGIAKKKPVAAKVPAPAAPTTTKRMIELPITKMEVQAYSEEHAKRLAAALTGVDIGHVLSAHCPPSKGLPPKKTQNADFPQRGTRRWVTEYQIFTYAQRMQVGLNKFTYIGLEFVKGGFDEKTKAVKAMKDLSVKHRLPMMVQIHKVLEGDSNVASLAEPDMPMKTYSVEIHNP